MTMNTLKAAVFTLALLLMASVSQAQTLINNTTLSAAVTSTSQNTVQLAAVTCTGCTFGPGTVLYVVGLGGGGVNASGSREAMVVTGAYSAGSGSLVVPVLRGQMGTVAAVHVNASVVYVGPPNRFHLATVGTPGNGDPQGPCGTRASQPFLPWINVLSGNVWNCDLSGSWYGINSAKLTYNSSGPLGAP